MNSRSLIKYIIYVSLVILIFAAIEIASVYHKIFGPNIQTGLQKSYTLFIQTGSAFNDVLDSLYVNNLIKNKASFEWAAEKKNYKAHVHSGRYILRNDMSNNELINMLRSGSQEPVQVIINNGRTVYRSLRI
jgi:UPF0755 protein